ncbi:hypothetical protein L1049_010992 [Liquidambar formosana]|uniref:UBL3-like ubiquitin domain-containing protein n=1 Tax=Liquidambar formosana TaxID=63359 RepID=A0AAP0RQP8_LIQFO
MKLIHAGKVLENSKTLAESRILFGDPPGGVTTMHVIVQPPLAKKKTGIESWFLTRNVKSWRFLTTNLVGDLRFLRIS